MDRCKTCELLLGQLWTLNERERQLQRQLIFQIDYDRSKKALDGVRDQLGRVRQELGVHEETVHDKSASMV